MTTRVRFCPSRPGRAREPQWAHAPPSTLWQQVLEWPAAAASNQLARNQPLGRIRFGRAIDIDRSRGRAEVGNPTRGIVPAAEEQQQQVEEGMVLRLDGGIWIIERPRNTDSAGIMCACGVERAGGDYGKIYRGGFATRAGRRRLPGLRGLF